MFSDQNEYQNESNETEQQESTADAGGDSPEAASAASSDVADDSQEATSDTSDAGVDSQDSSSDTSSNTANTGDQGSLWTSDSTGSTGPQESASDSADATDSSGVVEGSGDVTELQPVVITPSSGDGTDVIVDGDTECSIDGVTFKNWRAAKTDRGWPGNVMTQDIGWPRIGAPRPIDTIVIHETAGPSGFTRKDCGVHFLVNNDSTIYQIGDLKHRFHHASNGVINPKSIGIEFANDTYFEYKGAGERLPIKWRGKYKSIRIPAKDQLEAMVTLLDLLMKQYGVDRWLNATIAPGYFLLATNGLPLDPQPSGSSVLEPVEVGGLVTHSIIKQHGDGGFIALYAWLRLSGGKDPDDALTEAKRIAGSDPVDAKTVGKLIKTPNAWAITMMAV